MNELLDLYRTITGSSEPVVWPTLAGRADPPLRPIRVARNEAGIGDLTEPFIWRGFPLLPGDREQFVTLLRAEKEVFGYTKSAVENDDDGGPMTLPGADVWAQFQNRALKINILDSRCSGESQLLEQWDAARLKRPSFVCWVLSVAPKLTYFHVDPPYGGNFMYLCCGRKTWLFIPPDALAEVERRHGFKIINVLPLPELLRLDDGFLWGKIQLGEIAGGDLVYFPDGWPHFVRTTEDCLGYGGYFGAPPTVTNVN